jgi:hypothetical protein
MLPPSWKGEVQKAVEETIKTDADQRQTQQDNNAANITAALKAISDAQDRQTSHEDGSDKKNLALNVVTIILLFVTVFFTYKTWKTFEGQLEEMRKVYKPIEDQAKVAQETLIASSRGWIARGLPKLPVDWKREGQLMLSSTTKIPEESPRKTLFTLSTGM